MFNLSSFTTKSLSVRYFYYSNYQYSHAPLVSHRYGVAGTSVSFGGWESASRSQAWRSVLTKDFDDTGVACGACS